MNPATSRRPGWQTDQTTRRACFGAYELLHRISGTRAYEVFIVRRLDDEDPTRRYALKRTCPLHPESEDFFDAFIVETQLLASLDHPAIPTLVDFGEQDGWYYQVLGLSHGRDLAWITGALRRARQELPVDLAIHIGRAVAEALAYLHEKVDAGGNLLALSHQEVCPQSIYLTLDGRVQLLPFGIGRSYRPHSETTQGWFGGRYDYMAPEQAHGSASDHRSDIFALGVVLHELLCGRSLFSASNPMDTLWHLINSPIVPPSWRNPQIPAALDAVVLRSLARDPERRYQSVRELAIDLLLLTRADAAWVSRERLAMWVSGLDVCRPRLVPATSVDRLPPAEDRPAPMMQDETLVDLMPPLALSAPVSAVTTIEPLSGRTRRDRPGTKTVTTERTVADTLPMRAVPSGQSPRQSDELDLPRILRLEPLPALA